MPSASDIDLETWLRIEETSEVKHELVAGQLFAMAGASAHHNMLAAAVLVGVHPAAMERGCRAVGSDMALRVGTSMYYPDVMVICEPLAHERFEIAPCLVVEVLSPSTAQTDRREKRAAYCTLPSVQCYLIVEQNRRYVETHVRVGDRWLVQPYGPGETFSLPCPRVELSVDELYRGIE